MGDTEKLAVYPCLDCGKMRTKDEGGTTFTVCDECWEKSVDKHYADPRRRTEEEGEIT